MSFKYFSKSLSSAEKQFFPAEKKFHSETIWKIRRLEIGCLSDFSTVANVVWSAKVLKLKAKAWFTGIIPFSCAYAGVVPVYT